MNVNARCVLDHIILGFVGTTDLQKFYPYVNSTIINKSYGGHQGVKTRGHGSQACLVTNTILTPSCAFPVPVTDTAFLFLGFVIQL